MLHQPFEDWLGSEEALTPEQRQALESHLRDCAACAGLARALAEVDRTLQEAEGVGPEAGFGVRFAQRLEARQIRDLRRQGWVAFGVAAAAAALLLAPVAMRWLKFWDSPGELVVGTLIRAHDLAVGLRVAGGLARAFLSNLAVTIPPTWVLGFLFGCGGLVAVWVALMYRFAFRRVKEGVAR